MNKNKLIFIAGALVVVFFIVFMLNAISSEETTSGKTSSGNNPFVIWTLGDDPSGMQALITAFKQKYPSYEKTVFRVENFSEYDTYTQALSSAIIRGDAPDMFVQNNNETSLLNNQVLAIPNDIINPSDFRKQYKAVFGEDLIISFDEQSEFVTGVPIGYEVLGIYYNRKFVTSTDLTSQAALSSSVSSITRKNPDKIGIALGNGSTIVNASDLITQYFMLSGASSLAEVDDTILKTAMETYFRYGSDSSDNGYDSDVFVDLLSTGQNNLDLFSRGDVAMVVGYPRMLNEIAQRGYSDKFLLASYFPHYVGELGKTLVSYNSFVTNKDSTQLDTAYSLLQYMSSEEGADVYLNAYPYYLPGLLSLESQRVNRKVSQEYNITLGDFYNSSYELSSFDMIQKSNYQSQILNILDNAPSYRILFQDLVTQLQCRYTKIVGGTDLSRSCK